MLVTFRTIRTITYCILLSLLLFGCQEKKKIRGGSCKTDDDCLKGWICDEMSAVWFFKFQSTLSHNACLDGFRF